MYSLIYHFRNSKKGSILFSQASPESPVSVDSSSLRVSAQKFQGGLNIGSSQYLSSTRVIPGEILKYMSKGQAGTDLVLWSYNFYLYIMIIPSKSLIWRGSFLPYLRSRLKLRLEIGLSCPNLPPPTKFKKSSPTVRQFVLDKKLLSRL